MPLNPATTMISDQIGALLADGEADSSRDGGEFFPVRD